ncbi:MAG: PAS domain-containing protein [Nitrospirae bacterium]|nr:PAS domain-containing protein [Nitrospirota bacterium]
MILSIKARLSIYVAITIIIISAVSTTFYILDSHRSIEKKLIIRGEALSFPLAKAADEGLVSENLDLIGKAAHIVRTEDVELVQVYSPVWGIIDAYPSAKLKDPPDSDAVKYFQTNNTIFHKKITAYMYDFYEPVFYRPSLASPPALIGYVRLILSSSGMQKELRASVLNYLMASIFITLIVIAVLNMLINRLVINPVMTLKQSVLKFKNGSLTSAVPVRSDDEVGELISAFNQMAETINNNTLEIQTAKNKISEAMQDWENTFNTITDMITVHDKDFNIIRANKAAEQILGLPFLQSVKAKCYEYYHGAEYPPENCPSCTCLKTNEPASFELFEPHLDKSLEIRAIPRFDNNNNLIGLIHVVRDITEHKKMDTELKKRVVELEKFYGIAVGRELKMKDLKKEIARLKTELSLYKEDSKK